MLYSKVEPTKFNEGDTTNDKLNELIRFMNDFKKASDEIEKMISNFVALKFIPESEIKEINESIKEINGKYLSDWIKK